MMPAEMTVAPHHPINESQISQYARDHAVRLPVKFQDCPKLQISEYVNFTTWCHWGFERIDGLVYEFGYDINGEKKFYPDIPNRILSVDEVCNLARDAKINEWNLLYKNYKLTEVDGHKMYKEMYCQEEDCYISPQDFAEIIKCRLDHLDVYGKETND